MDLLQFLQALRARWRVFVSVVAVTVITAAAVSLMLPKSYKATASLLVDTKDEQSLNNSPQSLVFSMPQERLSYLQTQADIVSSRRVARQVVQDLRLADSPRVRTAFEKEATGDTTIEDWLVEGLLKKLKVETSQSNVIQATVAADDPRYAAQVANGFAKAYLDTVLELRVKPTRDAAVWFNEQQQRLKANLEAAQAKLTDYLQKRKIVAVDEDNTRLGALSDQAQKAQEQAFQWGSKERQARQYLDGGGSPERLPDVQDNALIQRLKADLSAGEAKLRELATQYGPNYPAYQRQESQNQSLRERLAAETRTVVSGIQNSARQSRAREADVATALAAQRTRVLAQRESRDEVAVLKRNVESAERAYDAALQRANTTEVESRARGTNVTLLNAATVPARPTSPRLTLNVALAAVVGTMLGIGIVLLLEMGDRRVRTRDDLVDNTWDVPVLVVLHAWEPTRSLLLPAPSGGRALPSRG